MIVPDGDVDTLSRDMVKQFPVDAADRAALLSNAFFVLGNAEKSDKWLRVSEQVKKIQGGASSGGPADRSP